MNRGIITISETGAVTIPTVPVWMTKFEIADLFGVFSCDIRKGDTGNLQEQGVERSRYNAIYQATRWYQL